MPRILITGKNGQIGRALLSAPWPPDCAVVAKDRHELDVSDARSVAEVVTAVRPHLIVNTAAFTAVDAAEDEEARAFAVNDAGVGLLAEAAQRAGCPLIHFSTDYVFDGSKGGEYREDAATNPLGAYGRSKLAGEQRLARSSAEYLNLRLSGVYDAAGSNFVRAILKAATSRPELTVVDDQTCGPTWSRDIASAVARLGARILSDEASFPWGTYHFCTRPSLTWYAFANEIFEIAARYGVPKPTITPIPGAEYPAKARRPKDPALNCDKFVATFAMPLPDRTVALEKVLKQILTDDASAA